MAILVIIVGAIFAAALLLLLAMPTLRIWPTPGPGTWQSYVWWPLFRGLNVLCFAAAVVEWPGGDLRLPHVVRFAAALVLVASVALFVAAFRLLGRDNSYGARDGLVTAGIYAWSRNPQNAMLVVVYGCLAVAADGLRTYVLSAAMMAVYVVMVLREEPWLRSTYGDAYRDYCARVPRFFPLRRAAHRVADIARRRG